MITTAQIKKLFPSAKPVLVAAVVNGWPLAQSAGINTTDRISLFLANIGVETGGLTSIVESLNYSVDGLLNTFGRHRISENDARRLGRKKGEKTLSVARQREIANLIYGGAWGLKNLGNRPGTNDGWERRGAGMMQSTGYANQSALGFADNPQDLANPEIAFATAVREWSKRGCNALTDKGDVVGVRRKINGGTNGLKEMRAYFTKARTIFRGAGNVIVPDGPAQPSKPAKPVPPVTAPVAAPEPPAPVPAAPVEPPQPVLTKELVRDVQEALLALGYTEIGGLDGIYGKFTRTAIVAFRLDNHLTVNDKIDRELLAALPVASPRVLAPARTEATAKTVVEKKPEAATNWWNKAIGAVGGLFSTIGGAIAGALQYTGVAKETLKPVKDAFAEIPIWLYVMLFGIVLFVIWRNSQKVETTVVEAFRDGSRR